MITFQHIQKSFSGKVVLQAVEGQFQSSKINLVIGASGGGKSLLLKCILGLVPPDAGQVFFDGEDFIQGTDALKLRIRRKIGMLFQSSALFDSKTVEENVQFPLDVLTTLSTKEKKERVQFCLERVGLLQAWAKMPSELSGGMKKRVGIARALVNHPKYLFCDEPNSGLDPRTSMIIDELIREVTYEDAITTIVVTHDQNTIISLGDSILFLDQGQKAWEGTSATIFDTPVQALQDFLFVGKLMEMKKYSVQKMGQQQATRP